MIGTPNILAMAPLIALPMVGLAICFAAIMFVVWLVVGVVQIAGRLMGICFRGAGQAMFGPPARSMMMPGAVAGRRCPRGGCGSVNPAEARFCGRCGMSLTAAPARRVAMF